MCRILEGRLARTEKVERADDPKRVDFRRLYEYFAKRRTRVYGSEMHGANGARSVCAREFIWTGRARGRRTSTVRAFEIVISTTGTEGERFCENGKGSVR